MVISRRGRQRDHLDELLAAHGLRRPVVLTVPAVLASPARHDRDPAHRWLRGLISELLTAITQDRR